MENQLFALCDAGLANRLHVLAGAKYIAEQTGRRLKIWWPCNSHLNAKFSRLFTNTEFEFLKPDDVANLLATENRVKVYNCGFNKTNTLTNECYDVWGDDKEEIVVIKSWATPRLRHHRDERAAMPYVLRTLRNLSPVPEVRDAVKEIGTHLLPESGALAVGVHVRYGDRAPGSKEWDSYIAGLYASSSLDSYFRMMDQVIDEEPKVKFFVASPNSAIEHVLLLRYGQEHVLVQKKCEDARDSVPGMREAVSDLYLLSMCKFIIGSTYSQYSMLASELGGARLIVAGSENAEKQLEEQLNKL